MFDVLPRRQTTARPSQTIALIGVSTAKRPEKLKEAPSPSCMGAHGIGPSTKTPESYSLWRMGIATGKSNVWKAAITSGRNSRWKQAGAIGSKSSWKSGAAPESQSFWRASAQLGSKRQWKHSAK